MNLFKSESFADIHFIVGLTDKETIPAHIQILANANEVFCKMFSGDFAIEKEIKVPDVKPDGFTQLLRYLYGGEPEINVGNSFVVLYAANKYMVRPLIEKCEGFLSQNLSTENVLVVFSQALLFDESDLLEPCLDFIYDQTINVLGSEEFLRINQSTMCEFLRQDRLDCEEIFLFDMVMKWAEERCKRTNLDATISNKRWILGDAINLIRFPTMEELEFTNGPVESGLLSAKEAVEVFTWFNIRNDSIIKYETTPREVNHYSDSTQRLKFGIQCGVAKFLTKSPILLLGIVTCSQTYHSIQLRKGNRVIRQHTLMKSLKGMTDHLFDIPAKIEVGEAYAIIFETDYSKAVVAADLGTEDPYRKGIQRTTPILPQCGGNRYYDRFSYCTAEEKNVGNGELFYKVPAI